MRSLLDYFNPNEANDFRDIASSYFTGRKKEKKSGNKYVLGALLLGLGDMRARKKAQTKYDAFTLADTVNRAKLKKEFDDYTSFFANHKNYTKDGQQTWEEGLRRDIVSKNATLREDVVLDMYNKEAQRYQQQLNRFTSGKFEGSLKQEKTYEELISPYEEIAQKAKRKLSPDNAGFLKNVFGNTLNIREDADTTLDNFNTKSQEYINSFNTAVEKANVTYGFQVEDYISDAQLLANKKNEVQRELTKLDEAGEVYSEDLILQAHAVGINPTGFKSLDNLAREDTDVFASALINKRALNKYDIANPEVYLSPKEQRVLKRVNPQTEFDLNLRDELENESNRGMVVNSINQNIINLKNSNNSDNIRIANQLEELGKFELGDKNKDISSGNASIFIDHVIEGAVELQRINPDVYENNYRKAYEDSFNMQLGGLQSGVKERRFRRDTQISTSEYVDPKVIGMPIVPETAQAVAKNLNEYRYLQRNLQDDNGDNAMRDTAGRTLTFSGTDREDNPYQVSFVLERDDENQLNWIVLN